MRAAIFAISILLLLLCTAAAQEWGGADELAEEAIGKLNPGYEPWFSPLWEPPSGEIESLLFSVQAAVGALIIGYILGYARSRNARNA